MKVLLADDNAERASALARLLAADPRLVVLQLRAGEALADAVAAQAPDIVLADMARPDRDALDGIRQVATHAPRPIVLFADKDDPGFMEAAIGAGVSSYTVPGVPAPDVKPILQAAAALFRRHQQARDGQRLAENPLQEREVIGRAKARLIRKRKLTEPDACRWLRNQAMSRGRRIVDMVAELIRDSKGDAP
ncbi:MAG: ANTAR domain-containing protein [Acetobacteraceae bacterium]|nr:ANTAR domain-containing protein [Acetobacteraceae bacterium]